MIGKRRDSAGDSKRLVELLQAKLGSHIKTLGVQQTDAVMHIEAGRLLDIFRLLKLDSELQLQFLVDITAVDWLDKQSERFDVVYHLLSLTHGYRLRVKVALPEQNPEIPSIVALWSSAAFLEREVWDMYGIRFQGHPDLRRILMYPEFIGHPLRKDYPVQAKQPRVPLRAPEVQNTARLMQRPELVKITPRQQERSRE